MERTKNGKTEWSLEKAKKCMPLFKEQNANKTVVIKHTNKDQKGMQILAVPVKFDMSEHLC